MKITVKAYFSLLKVVGGESPLEVEKPAAVAAVAEGEEAPAAEEEEAAESAEEE
jgi:hypothetical protein